MEQARFAFCQSVLDICKKRKERKMKLSVIGGDLRQLYAARTFMRYGAEVKVAALPSHNDDPPCVALEQALAYADAVLLPFPYTKDQKHLYTPLSDTLLPLSQLKIAEKTPVFCGKADLSLRGRAESGGWQLLDYTAWESFQAANAIPSAEGALSLAMQQLPCTLYALPVLIVGGGKIARHLCKLLCAFGAKVTLCARRDTDRFAASVAGCHAIDFPQLQHAASLCRLCFNTVPAPVIDRAVIGAFDSDAVLFDLASAPGGVDFVAAAQRGLRTFHALGIPASYAPQSAGVLLGELIWERLHPIGKEALR